MFISVSRHTYWTQSNMCSNSNYFFGCLSLKTGSCIISFLGMFSTIAFLIAYSVLFFDYSKNPELWYDFLTSLEIFDESHFWLVFVPINIWIFVLCLINLLLFFGIKTNKSFALIIWIAVNLLMLLVSHNYILIFLLWKNPAQLLNIKAPRVTLALLSQMAQEWSKKW